MVRSQRVLGRLVLLNTLTVTAATALSMAAPQSRNAPQCRPAGALVRVAELPEGSGAAASRRHPGRIWAHNDSGAAVLVALDDGGSVAGRVRLTGVDLDDWEAIAVGPCGEDSCVYIGDIGDNNANRDRITIYRLPEPDIGTDSVAVRDVFHATYPDGPHDAEALLVTPQGDIFVVTKGETGPVAIYQFPRDMKAGATVKLTRVGPDRASGKTSADERITDGAVAPNGEWVVLRTNRALHIYAAADFTSGSWRERGQVSVKDLKEPQGEGLAFGSDATLYLVGEGGGKSQRGTFVRLTCTL